MKKLLSMLAVVATLSPAWAQLPDGSIAPDFTMTDIYGETHNLYSYLDQGMSVILNFSAVWCGPCLDYKESGVLNDIYNAFGPEGSGDIMVLSFETQDDLGVEALYGNGGGTIGDFVTGTNYPIIDNAASLYWNSYMQPNPEVGPVPLIYTVCPNGTLTETGQATLQTHVSIATSGCGNAVINPAATLNYSGDEFYCAENNWEASATLTNLGEAEITSATIEVTFNNSTEMVNYNGTLSSNGTTEISLGTFGPETGVLESTLVSLNGEPRYAPQSQNILNSVSTTNQVVVEIMPDPFAEQVSWEIRDENNAVVAGATCAPVPEISWDALEVVQEWSVTLPSLGCYEFHLLDSGGNGMSAGAPGGQSSSGQTIFYPTAYAYSDGGPFQLTTILIVNTAQGDSYTDKVVRGFEVTSTSNVVEEAKGIAEATLAPNPTIGDVQIEFSIEQSSNMTIEVTNAMGQRIEMLELGTLSAGEHRTMLNLNGLETGMYNVVLRANNHLKTMRMVKQ